MDDISKEPAGTFNLVVSYLVQHFSSSDMDKDTKSKFFADGELVQYGDDFNTLNQSHMRVKMVNELFTSQTASVAIERYEDDPAPNLNESYCIFGGSSCSSISKPNLIKHPMNIIMISKNLLFVFTNLLTNELTNRIIG